MTIRTIDLNCDMGEGAGNDAAIMPFVSSASIACGGHAGDEDTMEATVALALQHSVAIGAHPGFADKANFGRVEMDLPHTEVYGLVTAQIYTLQKIAYRFGTTLRHVKPHGALYNMAAKDKALADTIVQAVKDVGAGLVLYGLYNSCLIAAAQEAGLQYAAEVFADRRYHTNGLLVNRQAPGAVIEDEGRSVEQVLQMVLNNTVTSIEGETLAVRPQTVCLHGDGTHAAAFAKKIHMALVANGIMIQKPYNEVI